MVASLALLSPLSAAFVASPLPLARHAGGRSRVSLYIAEETTSWIELLQAPAKAEAVSMPVSLTDTTALAVETVGHYSSARPPIAERLAVALRESERMRAFESAAAKLALSRVVAERDALETALRHGSSSYRGLPFLHSLRLCLAHGRTAARAACEDAGWAVWWARESAKKALGRLRYRAALLRLRTALAAGRWITRLRTPTAVGLPSAEPPEPPESAVAAAALAAPGAALVGVVVQTGTSAGGASAGGASAGANADAGAGYAAWAGEWARAHSDASAAVAGPAVAASPAVAQRRVVVLPKYSL